MPTAYAEAVALSTREAIDLSEGLGHTLEEKLVAKSERVPDWSLKDGRQSLVNSLCFGIRKPGTALCAGAIYHEWVIASVGHA